jgi:hypothetical protein
VSGRDYWLDGGSRGWVIQEGTQGVPERTKASSRKRGADNHGLTAWDLKMAARDGLTLADLLRRREAASAWIDAFQAKVRERLNAAVPSGPTEAASPSASEGAGAGPAPESERPRSLGS